MHLADFQYAKALLQSFPEISKVEILHKETDTIILPSLHVSEMRNFLKNPTISSKIKSNTLKNIFTGKIDQVWFPFFSLVLNNKRAALLEEILRSFLAQAEAKLNVKQVFITTAYELTDELIGKFKEIGSNLTKCKNITLKTIINPDIIGGYVMNFDSMQVDCSLKGGLLRLKKQLNLGLL